LKLFLKGTRCDTPKCAIERRENPPGQQQQRRGKLTDYGQHLREKQKVKHYYGVLERQFRKYFEERRLDNIVHRLGFGQSRAQARQIIRHGHITVNGRKVDIPSYQVRVGDVIRAKNRAKSLDLVRGAIAESSRDVPDFLSRSESQIPEGIVGRLPAPDDVSIPVQTQLIVELCSR
jgi:small subunit ribosomal protein S4